MNNRFIFVLCFPILIVSLTVATYGLEGQQTGEFQIKYVETEEFPLNYIYYTVRDHNGNYAEDMYLDHIVLKENKLEHEPFKIEDDIKSFPVVVSLIIDSSGSMKRVMSDVKEAAKYFVDKVNKNIKILPIDFDSEVRPLCPISDDQEELKKQIDKIKADGGTALYDSIKEGCQKIKDFKGFRVVLVLTDGKDENRTNTGPGSKIDLDTLKENISPLNIPVYSIGLGDGVDEKVLKDISIGTGGMYYHSKNADELGRIYRDIIDFTSSMRRFYYISRDGDRDGKKRKIDIRVKYVDGINDSITYTSPLEDGFNYVFKKQDGDDLTTICDATISADSKTIYVPEYDCLFDSEGERIYGNLLWEDNKRSINSGEYIQVEANYPTNSDLYKVEDMELKEIDPKRLYDDLENDYPIPEENKDGHFIKAISSNSTYVVIFTKLKDMEGKFAFTLANIKKNKALYTSVLPKVNNGMPDMVRVSDNRLVYLTVDHNLFGFDQDGNEMFFWNRDEMGRRVNDISITNDGKFGIAWLDMGGIDRAIAPEWEVVLFDKSGMIIKGKSTKGLGQRNRVSISPDGEYYGFNSRKGPRVYRFSDDELVFSKEVEVKKSEWENFIDIAEDKSIVYNIRSRIFKRSF